MDISLISSTGNPRASTSQLKAVTYAVACDNRQLLSAHIHSDTSQGLNHNVRHTRMCATQMTFVIRHVTVIVIRVHNATNIPNVTSNALAPLQTL
jgi:hypothetical protein